MAWWLRSRRGQEAFLPLSRLSPLRLCRPPRQPSRKPSTSQLRRPTEALTATPGSDSISTLEPTPTAIDTPPPTEIVQEPITECNAGTLEAPPEAYADFVDLLTKLWLLDAELCSAIVKQPWILGQSGADGGGAALKDKLILLESLYNLASTDLELADLVVSVPWFADELTYWKRRVVLELSNLAAKNADLARIIAGFPWFTEGLFDEPKVVFAVSDLNESGLISTGHRTRQDHNASLAGRRSPRSSADWRDIQPCIG